jgi:hypothetical protein
MIIGQINSIRFRPVNSDLPNFANTFLANEKFYNDGIITYCQRFLPSDTITIQIKSDSATVPTVTATKIDKTTVSITASLVSSYSSVYFFEFDVDMSLFSDESYITVVQGSETWKSEPFKGCTELQEEINNQEVQTIEYFNFDNAFQVDFSTGITFKLYVNSVLKDYEFGGESSDYDNQDELTKLKETVQRSFVFRTLEIPRYIAETIRLASSCDNLVINDISYVRTELPEISQVEGTNFVDYSMTLNDKEYLGVNSHDIGFDVDTPTVNNEIMVLHIANASGGGTFSITGGYLIHTLTAEYVSGTTVEVKIGTTIGGNELVNEFNLSSSITRTVAQVHSDESDSNYDIYSTVTGGVANLTLQLIKNEE